MGTRPTNGALGASLKRTVEAYFRLGRAAGWSPAEGSAALETWKSAEAGALARTVTEADAHASALAQSALEHSRVVADAITRGRPFIPQSVGRTAVEHALRAIHQLDDEATDTDRAIRRLQEWADAISESQKLREGMVKAAFPGADSFPDETVMKERVAERAKALGVAVAADGKRLQIAGRRRLDTIKLAELYLAGGQDGTGIPSLLMRRHAAAAHGLETGLLLSAAEVPGPGGVNILAPRALEPDRMAFELMGVPLAVFSAAGMLARRFGWQIWPAYRKAQVEQERTLEVWRSALND